MRLVFLGTPAFAVPTLERMVQAGHEVPAVITQPDRPRGRGQNAAPSPVKEAAERLGLPVYQPERIRRPEALEYLRGLGADGMVVVGYGQIIPQSVIDLAPVGIINVHASLLPKYRGAAPIQWAIANGETRTGVTTMRIDAGLDTGDMLLKAQTEIGPEENAIELGQRLAVMGADLLVETMAGLAAGTIVAEKQDASQATLAPILKKDDGLIDWTLDAEKIRNRMRGLQPWPLASTTLDGARLVIRRTAPLGVRSAIGPSSDSVTPERRNPDLTQGTVLRAEGDELVVACGGGTALRILELQPEGRRTMTAREFLAGRPVAAGARLQ